MNTTPKAWQKLLCEAFDHSEIRTNRKGITNLLNIRRFVYSALHDAGIENRSPFSFWQLVKIRYKSQGLPQQVRAQCRNTVLNMHKPSFCLLSSSTEFLLVAAPLCMLILLTPTTATLLKPQSTKPSVFQEAASPWEDQKIAEMSLPSGRDQPAPLTITPESDSLPSVLIPALDASLPDLIPAPDTKDPTIMPEGLQGADWIRNQTDSAYALQLLSVTDESNLLTFCKRHNICQQSAFYRTQVKGKTMVRLIYGSFPNHQSAKLAKAELPDSLKNARPWARPFKQIKNEL